MPATAPETKTCLEVTGNIVIAAIQNGLISGEVKADDIAAYFKTVYSQVYASGLMIPANVD